MLRYILSYMSGDGDPLEFILMICVTVFVTLCCLPVHEAAHAWMAEKLGDSTGRLSGRITLSPFAHLSLMGTLMLFLFGFGFAKPVPVNIRNFKKRKLYMGLTALAGPVSNLILAVIFIIIGYVCALFMPTELTQTVSVAQIASMFFVNVGYYNICLAVFNLIPFPPLDGSRILTMFLPDKIYYRVMQYERYLLYALFALIFLFNRLPISPLSAVSDFIFDGIGTCIEFFVNLIANLFM
ncbi:MAG: site-2 protease family protein [Clostridia bacterium]|nr:site-2 protease family protein [Clostridia bacterium]